MNATNNLSGIKGTKGRQQIHFLKAFLELYSLLYWAIHTFKNLLSHNSSHWVLEKTQTCTDQPKGAVIRVIISLIVSLQILSDVTQPLRRSRVLKSFTSLVLQRWKTTRIILLCVEKFWKIDYSSSNGSGLGPIKPAIGASAEEITKVWGWSTCPGQGGWGCWHWSALRWDFFGETHLQPPPYLGGAIWESKPRSV